VEPVLKPFEPHLCEIVLGAWEDWMDSSEAGRYLFPRTRATVVHDRMVDRALAVLPSLPGINHVERDQTVSFIVDDQVLFRFKKGDTSGLSRNFPTQQALAFHDHEQSLFGPLEWVRVEVVYVLNRIKTSVENVFIVARDGNKISWLYDILSEAASTGDIEMAPVHQAGIEQLVRLRDPEEGATKRKLRG
jgi:hypothetical protein